MEYTSEHDEICEPKKKNIFKLVTFNLGYRLFGLYTATLAMLDKNNYYKKIRVFRHCHYVYEIFMDEVLMKTLQYG